MYISQNKIICFFLIFLSVDNPWVRLNESHVNRFVGERQILTCHVVGTPTPNVTWLRNGKVLRDGDFNRTVRIRDNTLYGALGGQIHKLLLDNVQREHSGNYTCEAKNKYFTRRRNAVVAASCKLLCTVLSISF